MVKRIIRIHLHPTLSSNVEDIHETEMYVPYRKLGEIMECLRRDALVMTRKMLKEGKLPIWIEIEETPIKRFKNRPAKRHFTIRIKWLLQDKVSVSDIIEVEKRLNEELKTAPDGLKCLTLALTLIYDQFKGVGAELPNPWK